MLKIVVEIPPFISEAHLSEGGGGGGVSISLTAE